MTKAVVLLSGGLDSTVSMGIALQENRQVYPLSIEYGQRHKRELASAMQVTGYYRGRYLGKVNPICIVQLPNLFQCPLTGVGQIPVNRDIDESIPATYVPARNSIFLSIATAYAEKLDCDEVWVGFNAVDYSGYPDCRPEYVTAMETALALGTKRGVEGNPIKIVVPIILLSKKQIVKQGLAIQVPFKYTWSCYAGGERPCGECDSCRIREGAFAELEMRDPALTL